MTDDVHALLNRSIETIANTWIDELKAIRENTTVLEAQLLACVSKTKTDIAKLHDLGAQVAEEAKRGRETCAKLTEGVAAIVGEQVA